MLNTNLKKRSKVEAAALPPLPPPPTPPVLCTTVRNHYPAGPPISFAIHPDLPDPVLKCTISAPDERRTRQFKTFAHQTVFVCGRKRNAYFCRSGTFLRGSLTHGVISQTLSSASQTTSRVQAASKQTQEPIKLAVQGRCLSPNTEPSRS